MARIFDYFSVFNYINYIEEKRSAIDFLSNIQISRSQIMYQKLAVFGHLNW